MEDRAVVPSSIFYPPILIPTFARSFGVEAVEPGLAGGAATGFAGLAGPPPRETVGTETGGVSAATMSPASGG